MLGQLGGPVIFSFFKNARRVRERADVVAVVFGARRIDECVEEGLAADDRQIVSWQNGRCMLQGREKHGLSLVPQPVGQPVAGFRRA